jgi:hypothetical protein
MVELYRVLQKELCNGIPNVTVWRVLRKRLHLKAYRLSVIQHDRNKRQIITDFGI